MQDIQLIALNKHPYRIYWVSCNIGKKRKIIQFYRFWCRTGKQTYFFRDLAVTFEQKFDNFINSHISCCNIFNLWPTIRVSIGWIGFDVKVEKTQNNLILKILMPSVIQIYFCRYRGMPFGGNFRFLLISASHVVIY